MRSLLKNVAALGVQAARTVLVLALILLGGWIAWRAVVLS